MTNKVASLQTESKSPVTGLSFNGSGKQTHVFVSTENEVMSFNLLGRSPKKVTM